MPTVITDIFVEDLEGKIFTERVESPRVWKRFVDDVLAVVKKNYGNMLLEKLNSVHENISFTSEEEADDSLPFMDVRFTRRENGKLARTVYQKSMRTNRYVQFQSHQPNNVKSGVVKSLARRTIVVCNDQEEKKADLG